MDAWGDAGRAAFRGQRWRVLIPLAAIVLLFAAIASWNLGDAGYSGFYSSAARSMSVSWRAFFFGSFDPGATVTLDKLAGFLVPQALSARLFGFSAWSIALPQVIEGAITIVVAYVIACRWRGPSAGLVAALALATTPLAASMFGHVMEDGLLTMSLALAFLCWQSSIRSGRILPLLACAAWIAIGFQAKMLQAWLILPALLIGLLVVTSQPFLVRVGRALLLLLTSVVASLSWMIVVQLIPASSRPYIDGSTNDNVFSMVFGYNGVNRIIPNLIPGAAPDFVGSVVTLPAGSASHAKLLLPAFTTQVGWLYPLALLGIGLGIAALLAGRRAGLRLPFHGATLVALGVWLLTLVGLLSVAAIPHTAYLAAISVQVAVFAGVGAVEAVRLFRSSRSRARRAVVPLAVAAQTAWILVILIASGVSPAWLTIAVGVLGTGSAIALLALASTRGRPVPGARARRTLPALTVAAVAVILAPAIWTGSVVDLPLGGSANDAYGGPRTEPVALFFQAPGAPVDARSFGSFDLEAPVLARPGPGLSIEQQHLVEYLRRRVGDAGILMMAGSWDAAEPYILGAGLPVASLGGYSGAEPTPTLTRVEELVRAGSLRYFLLPSPIPVTAATRPTEKSRIENWVGRNCTYIPDDEYEGATTLADQSLWDCRGVGAF